jgi:hypothetical protein
MLSSRLAWSDMICGAEEDVLLWVGGEASAAADWPFQHVALGEVRSRQKVRAMLRQMPWLWWT